MGNAAPSTAAIVPPSAFTVFAFDFDLSESQAATKKIAPATMAAP